MPTQECLTVCWYWRCNEDSWVTAWQQNNNDIFTVPLAKKLNSQVCGAFGNFLFHFSLRVHNYLIAIVKHSALSPFQNTGQLLWGGAVCLSPSCDFDNKLFKKWSNQNIINTTCTTLNLIFFILPFLSINWSTFDQQNLHCVRYFNFDFPYLPQLKTIFCYIWSPHIGSSTKSPLPESLWFWLLHNSNKWNHNIGENVIQQHFHHLHNFVQLFFVSDNDNFCTGVTCHIFHLEQLIIMMMMVLNLMMMMMSIFFPVPLLDYL